MNECNRARAAISEEKAAEINLRKAFWYSAAVTFIVKCLLAAVIPLTSDEAYFVIWAQHLDFGYYDHPPMIGWILRLFMCFGGSELVLRLPAILSTILIGVGICEVLKRFDRERAFLTGTLFLVSPLNILYVLVTTDTPVIFFAFISAYFLAKAVGKDGNLRHYLLTGLFLGGAFLSKYFAALLGFAYLTYFLTTPRDSKKRLGFLIVFLSVVPFALVNLYWNYTHAWANIMFNVFNRNKQETYSLGTVAVFLVSQAYLMTPPLVYYLVKKKTAAWKAVRSSDTGRFFGVLFVVPLLIFLFLSFKKNIGLHWTLSFYPFLFITAFFFLSLREMMKSLRFMVVFSFVHLSVIGAAFSLPLESLKDIKNYNIIVLGLHPDGVVHALQPYEKDFVFATNSYAISALMGYQYGRYFSVFGGGSLHGRQDDLITDFRELNGRNILIMKKSAPEPGEYGPYFVKLDVKQFTVDKGVFHIVLGYDFKYAAYRDAVLAGIKKDFYDIPPYLPVKTNYFTNKYF